MYGTIESMLQQNVWCNILRGATEDMVHQNVLYDSNRKEGSSECMVQQKVWYNRVYETTECMVQQNL